MAQDEQNKFSKIILFFCLCWNVGIVQSQNAYITKDRKSLADQSHELMTLEETWIQKAQELKLHFRQVFTMLLCLRKSFFGVSSLKQLNDVGVKGMKS